MSDKLIARVAVENLLSYVCNDTYSYIIPDENADMARAGSRVMVPFGKGDKLRQGFIFEIFESADDSETQKLKSIYSVADSEPLLSSEMLSLAQWLHDRCFCSLFTAAKSLLPGGVCVKSEKTYRRAQDIPPEKLDLLSDDERLIISYLSKKKDFVRESLLLKKISVEKNSPILKKMSAKGLLSESANVFSTVKEASVLLVRLKENADGYDGYPLTDKQIGVINTLKDIGAASVKEICYFTGVSESVVKGLITKNICETFSAPLIKEKTNEVEKVYSKPVLSTQQAVVYNTLFNAYKNGEKKAALLHGVTGSGKTSIYLQLIDDVLADGKSAIVLVPEISLTPQTFGIFSSRYGNDVAVLHSALSMRERFDEWKRIKDGKAHVVIGTRSAVFAPLENLGLIVIDEEQEHTYKSEMSPRYNAKDVARFRCSYNKAFLLYSSATPSIETYAKAVHGQILLCELKTRYGKAVLPQVVTVDMTQKKVLTSCFSLSDTLAKELETNLQNHEQSILLVNRRGFNTFVVCSECKKVITCPNCSISMTYHSANDRLMCHYCGYSIPYAAKCPTCSAENIRYSGVGTQKVEQELKIRFPSARVLRMDADTTLAKDAHEKTLSAFAAGEYDILIGTQMVAKGLDFPNVTLVGITSADKELYNNDFRSAERSFDLITQVVGRAGRGSRKGRAVIQTVAPDNNIIQTAAKQDYESFYRNEIALRKALVYPPFCDLCEIGISGVDENATFAFSRKIFDYIVNLNKNEYSEQKIIILGPMTPRVAKVNGRYRKRILIKCKNSERFRLMIRSTLSFAKSAVNGNDINVYADINPEILN